MFVYVFNGMCGLNYCELGMVGVLLFLEYVFFELICDGYYVYLNVVGILMEKVGYEYVVLIIDCMMVGGMFDGNYNLGEFLVVVKEGMVCLEFGNLVGSILKLKEVIKNVVDWGFVILE